LLAAYQQAKVKHVSAQKKKLGKGLGALIGGSGAMAQMDPVPIKEMPSALPDGTELVLIDPRTVYNNPKQPRREFVEEHLQELAQSIRNEGVLEPVVVRKRENGEYELVSGERRVRASILAELAMVPAVCRMVSDSDMLRLGIIENVQREDLNPIELARAYGQLLEEMQCTQEELSNVVGKRRATITNTMRLLQLPEDIQDHVIQQTITMGHARALLSLGSPEEQRIACRKIIEGGLSVREAEKVTKPTKAKGNGTPVAEDPHITAIEDQLRKRFGTRVNLKCDAQQRGKIEFYFYSLDDLDRILDLLR
jgi:ParB family transcriptional regulator, chromosome partitioning protein